MGVVVQQRLIGAGVDECSTGRRQRAAARPGERRPAPDAVHRLHQLVGRLVAGAVAVAVSVVGRLQTLRAERAQQQREKQVQHLNSIGLDISTARRDVTGFHGVFNVPLDGHHLTQCGLGRGLPPYFTLLCIVLYCIVLLEWRINFIVGHIGDGLLWVK